MIPTLLTAIEGESEASQDAFQATVCLGWLHYVMDEPGLALAHLPADVGEAAARVSRDGAALSGWSRVCVVKGAYLKGTRVAPRMMHAADADSVQVPPKRRREQWPTQPGPTRR